MSNKKKQRVINFFLLWKDIHTYNNMLNACPPISRDGVEKTHFGGTHSSLAHTVSECFYCGTDMLLHSSHCASAMPTGAGMAQQ